MSRCGACGAEATDTLVGPLCPKCEAATLAYWRAREADSEAARKVGEVNANRRDVEVDYLGYPSEPLFQEPEVFDGVVRGARYGAVIGVAVVVLIILFWLGCQATEVLEPPEPGLEVQQDDLGIDLGIGYVTTAARGEIIWVTSAGVTLPYWRR